MAYNFGGVDYFAFADTGKIVCQRGRQNTVKSEVKTSKADGDSAKTDQYNSYEEYESEYVVVGDTGNVTLPDVGEIKAADSGLSALKRMVTAINIRTSNTGRPVVTLRGRETSETSGNLYTPSITLARAFGAQRFGSETAATSVIIDSSYDFTATIVEQLGKTGTRVKHTIIGGIEKATNTTIVASDVADTSGGWRIDAGGNQANSNADHEKFVLPVSHDVIRD